MYKAQTLFVENQPESIAFTCLFFLGMIKMENYEALPQSEYFRDPGGSTSFKGVCHNKRT